MVQLIKWIVVAGCLSLLCACGAPQEVPFSSADSFVQEEPAEESVPTAKTPSIPDPPVSDDTFVRVQDYIPDLCVELKYATEDNFTGTTIYSFSDAYLRYGTVKKLSAAADMVSADGYRLKIWDAFRPTAAQFRLWEICPDPRYVADPNNGFSSHSRGNTVDITLISADGSTVEMPTEFDDFSAMADRDYSDVSETAANNARYLENVMTACGFRPYSGEWWHFSDTDFYEVDTSFNPS